MKDGKASTHLINAVRIDRELSAAAWMDDLAERLDSVEPFAEIAGEQGMDTPEGWAAVALQWQHLATIAARFIEPYPADIRQRADTVLGRVMRHAEPLVRKEGGRLAATLQRDPMRDILQAARRASTEAEAVWRIADELKAHDARHGVPTPPQGLPEGEDLTLGDIAKSVQAAAPGDGAEDIVSQAEAGRMLHAADVIDGMPSVKACEKRVIKAWQDEADPLERIDGVSKYRRRDIEALITRIRKAELAKDPELSRLD